ncbi:MAG TPA: penicillin-binding protein 2 [Gammaproteobacteria bacterium]|nr:penicillin-binding protein 2 [Acidiferrobacteraceae bacterium]HAA36757.1 penicillin-binding protein 2 [Gammaproteobacteria bacterium]HAF74369.1 penicillin-binding protein 2 [Gammaproteobacteria bacterium]|tara:strand:- start:5345 stop:7225 length:1881 start_codon:yes stop_codon:yes gene_type:complete
MAANELPSSRAVAPETVRRRIRIAAVLALTLSLILIWRFYSLQVLQYERYQTLSLDNHIRMQAVPPVRGLILDRNGVVLAQNTAVHILQVVPEKVHDIEVMLQAVDELVGLSTAEVEAFRSRLKKHPAFEKVLLKARLDDVQTATFAVNEYRLPGVTLEAVLHRDYPQGSLVSHVLGYVGRISESEEAMIDPSAYQGVRSIGKIGIEKQYEDLLLGRPGFAQVEIDAHGRTLRTISRNSAIPGNTLNLTLDADLQRIAREALGNRRGAVVAIAPSNGEVLTMVSSPSFDPNLFVDGIDQQTYDALRGLEDRPLVNRALYGRYAPGSTIKPVIAQAILDAGISPQESVYCPGWYTLPDSTRRYRCWKKTGHGPVNLHGAVEQSCDVYFYEMGRRLGIEAMAEVLTRFGLGTVTGVDLPDEPDGLVPTPEWKRATRNESWYPGEDLITVIGQGFLMVTPMQLARMTATLANRGIPVQPRILLSKEESLSGETLSSNVSSQPAKPAVEASLDRVIQSMTAVMHSPRGTARASGRRSPYQIAGKTGTAQVIGIAQDEEYDESVIPEKFHDHALFIAFAPVDKPQIAIAVVVENGGSGAKAAAPIARKVMDRFFQKKLQRAAVVRKRHVFG